MFPLRIFGTVRRRLQIAVREAIGADLSASAGDKDKQWLSPVFSNSSTCLSASTGDRDKQGGGALGKGLWQDKKNRQTV